MHFTRDERHEHLGPIGAVRATADRRGQLGADGFELRASQLELLLLLLALGGRALLLIDLRLRALALRARRRRRLSRVVVRLRRLVPRGAVDRVLLFAELEHLT